MRGPTTYLLILIHVRREKPPRAMWHRDELIVPGPAAARPAALDLIRAAGGEITGLTAEEGRLDEFYRALVEAHP